MDGGDLPVYHEDREWLNDERNVLTEYNCSEAKGLARPCTAPCFAQPVIG